MLIQRFLDLHHRLTSSTNFATGPDLEAMREYESMATQLRARGHHIHLLISGVEDDLEIERAPLHRGEMTEYAE